MNMQILDVNYTTRNNDPIVQLFGILPDGKSCMKQVVGHKPYFFIEIEDSKEKNVIKFITSKSYIVEVVNRFRPVGFQTKTVKMFKIVAHHPKHIKDLRIELEGLDGVKAMYEGDILYKNRVLIDNNIGGMSWVDVKEEEDCITWEEVRLVDVKKPALLKCLSIDIETLPPDTSDLTHIMPTSDKDPVIMISLAFDPPYEGNRDLVLIGKQLKCPRPDIQSFGTESDMLYEFLRIIKNYDPSILVGFNILGYDFPYLNERMLRCGIKPSFGRDNSAWYIKDVLGGKNVSIAGRVVIDLLPIIRRDQDPKMKLSQYNLKTVVHELIKMEKYDEPASKMRGHWFSSGIEFNKFVSYARHDAVLVMFLLNQLKFLERLTALSRASGALLQDVANGGQSNMIEALLLRRFKADNRVLNIKPAYGKEESDDSELKGATVLDIEKGLLENLLILDFKSLYPTLMIANNLCYTTVVVDEVPEKFGVSPLGAKFASPEIKKGIVPQILTELLDERISIKKQMKIMSDGQDKDALDARQYAIKILLNSFYGYSGYKRARLYSLDVAGAVTSNGRANLLRTKDVIEKEIGSIDEKELRIVYGDTDSVFVKVGKNTGKLMDPDEAEKIGSMIAKVVTKDLPEPMELVFEAFSKRSLFLAKKRYALWRFEKGKDGWKDKMKYSGIEVKRRDFCPLIANTLSTCLDLILKKGDIEGAKTCAKKSINRVRDFSLADSQLLEELILTRKYGKTVDEYRNKQPHTVLLEKMRLRGEELPGIGDRIPFLIIKGKTKRDRAREKFVERAETPSRVKEMKLPIDVAYYVEKQLLPPLTRLLSPFGITSQELDMHNQSTLLAFL